MRLPRDPRSPLLGAVAIVHLALAGFSSLWVYTLGSWPVNDAMAPRMTAADWSRMAWSGFASGAVHGLLLGLALYGFSRLVGRWRPEVTGAYAAAFALVAAGLVVASAAVAALKFARPHPIF